MSYRMYTPAGDEAVADLVLSARLAIAQGIHQDAVQAMLREQRDDMDRAGLEVKDTAVRQAIAEALDPDWRTAYGSPFDEWLGVTPEPITVSTPFEA